MGPMVDWTRSHGSSVEWNTCKHCKTHRKTIQISYSIPPELTTHSRCIKLCYLYLVSYVDRDGFALVLRGRSIAWCEIGAYGLESVGQIFKIRHLYSALPKE
jgi:hypothetical protein